MKTVAFITILLFSITSPVINFAQDNSNSISPVKSFYSCIKSKGINCSLTNVNKSVIHFNGRGTIDSNQVKACLDSYDKSRVNSPESPAIIFITNKSIHSSKSTQSN